MSPRKLADTAKYVRLYVVDKQGVQTGEYLEIPYVVLARAATLTKLPGELLQTRTVPIDHNHPVPGQRSYYFESPYYGPEAIKVTDEERTAWTANCPKCQAGDPL